MPPNPKTGYSTLDKFLLQWPIEKLRKMSVEQFADLHDRNAFCYWLEYGSKDLGVIGGIHLNKFGLWKHKKQKKYSETYQSDKVYTWSKKFGDSRGEAFKAIKGIIIEIAEASIANDWDLIEKIGFHAIVKWKIAFLYSDLKLFPVYARKKLLKICSGLNAKFPDSTPVVDLQRFIISRKAFDETMVEYSYRLWDLFIRGRCLRNYFLVDTCYHTDERDAKTDIFPEMLSGKSIAVGYLTNVNLSFLVGRSKEDIRLYISSQYPEKGSMVNKIADYFGTFLTLKEGDIIGVKRELKHGYKIIAYGIVVERNSNIYDYRPDELSHHIHVDFIETEVSRFISYNYCKPIQIVESDKLEHLSDIFGNFLLVDRIILNSTEREEFDDTNLLDGEDISEPEKSERSYVRGAVEAVVVRQFHNIIQNSFLKDLKKRFPNDSITLEYENRVDILRETPTERWFYEIKPSEDVSACMRAATGQLLEYAFRFCDDSKATRLVVVGPGALKDISKALYHYYVDNLKLPLSYEQHEVKMHWED